MNRRTAVKIFKRQQLKLNTDGFSNSEDFPRWVRQTDQYVKDLCKPAHILAFNHCQNKDDFNKVINDCIEYVIDTQPTFTDREFEMIKWILPAIIASMTTLLSLTLPLILSGNLREHFCTWLQSF